MVTWFGQVHQESWQSITRNKEKQRNTCPACLPPYILNLISKILKRKSIIVLNFGRGENLEKALSTSLKHAACLSCFCGEEKEQMLTIPPPFWVYFPWYVRWYRISNWAQVPNSKSFLYRQIVLNPTEALMGARQLFSDTFLANCSRTSVRTLCRV